MRVICVWCNAVIAEPGEEEGTSLGTCETCAREQAPYFADLPEPDPLAPPVTDEALEQEHPVALPGVEDRHRARRARDTSASNIGG
jgi:hypothetical protein